MFSWALSAFEEEVQPRNLDFKAVLQASFDADRESVLDALEAVIPVADLKTVIQRASLPGNDCPDENEHTLP